MICRFYCLFILAIVGVAGSSARDLIHLKSGYSIAATSYTQRGSLCIVQIGSGSMELSTSDIDSIEVLADEKLPAESAKAEPVSAEDLLKEAATAEGVDEAFVRSVAKIESGLKPGARSAKGAIGLMQLMPATAAALGVDPTHDKANARGGTKYLRSLLLQYHGNSALALAAYNAGPGAVKHYGGIPPFAETQQYIRKVTQEYDRQRRSRTTQTHPEGQQLATRSPAG